MQKRAMVIWALALALAMGAGCFDPVPEARRPQRKARAQKVYIQVKPMLRGRSAWVLERIHGNSFTAAPNLAIHAAPGDPLTPHQLGALPVTGREFTLWYGVGYPPGPLASYRQIAVPTAGGPWQGLVVELKEQHRYPALPFFPVPGQLPGARPVATTVHFCHRSSSDACIPWSRAVDNGRVQCQTARGRSLSPGECRWYVPRTVWHIVGQQGRAW